MAEDKISWCFNNKKRMLLEKPKEHLSESYMKEADETFESMAKIKGKWKAIMGYYSCYNALYSVLIKCGIMSENHECSIEAMKILGFEEEFIDFMRKMKQKRIDAQYYLKDVESENDSKVKEFISECKKFLVIMNDAKVERIREQIKELMKW